MAVLPVLPPSSHVLIGTQARPDIPEGTAEKQFYDWMLAIQRIATGVGSTDGSDALPGQVGEFLSGQLVQTSALALTTGVAANVTSIPLTAGDWRVWFNGRFWPTPGTNISGALFSVSTVSATLQDSPHSRQAALPVPDAGMIGGGAAQIMSANVGPTRVVTTAPLTIYAVAYTIFSGGALRAYGQLQAERRR